MAPSASNLSANHPAGSIPCLTLSMACWRLQLWSTACLLLCCYVLAGSVEGARNTSSNQIYTTKWVDGSPDNRTELQGQGWSKQVPDKLIRCRDHQTSYHKKKILILQIDSQSNRRPPEFAYDTKNVDGYVVGPAYMRTYAEVHGYSYLRAVVPATSDKLWVTYWKPWVVRHFLDKADVVLTLDMDCAPVDLRLSLGCLLDHHNFRFDDPASVAMPEDPAGNDLNWIKLSPAFGEKRQLSLNVGMLVTKNTETARKMLTDWWGLASVPMTECGDFYIKDQGRFNACVRPKYEEGKDYVVLPCHGFNGYGSLHKFYGHPYGPHNSCEGQYFAHAWADKALMRDFLLQQLSWWSLRAHTSRVQEIDLSKLLMVDAAKQNLQT